jgi:hypothetical protein
MKHLILTLCAIILFGFTVSVYAQSNKSGYDHHAAFAPEFFANQGNLFRGSNGLPGPRYWQNEANYTVEAKLDTTSRMLTGDVKINYINNSPHDLQQLWLQLIQNRGDSTSISGKIRGFRFRRFRSNRSSAKIGFTIKQVRINMGGDWQKADYLVLGSKMQIRLPKTLKGNGTHIEIDIRYELGLRRYTNTKNGNIYSFSHWYPVMAVYDDLRGWNPLWTGEFYLDYGTIDYKVTVPAGMVVAGSGKLMNPNETLTQKELSRLNKARHSSKTVLIRSIGQQATAKGKNGMLTWHFHMENTRDVAWAASKAFIWDAATAKLSNGKNVLAQSVYPTEAGGRNRWGRATQYLKFSLEYFSKQWMPYAYSSAINCGCFKRGGVEYPGITFDGYTSKGYGTFMLVSHEIGHNWFPMMVGSNESYDVWMDEGFNTFIDIYAHKNFNNGEFAPKRDHEYAPAGGNPSDEVIPVITQKNAVPIMSKGAQIGFRLGHPTEYFKAAYGLHLLREVILGHKRFDYAFRHYARGWKFKHPSPKDFFRTMNNFTGENLNWFWRGWFIHNWKLDQAVTDVSYVKNNSKNGAIITLENLGKMPMPVLLTIKTTAGKTKHIKLPAQVWEKGATYKYYTNTTGKLTSAQLDPNHKLPDVNRANNSWKPELDRP